MSFSREDTSAEIRESSLGSGWAWFTWVSVIDVILISKDRKIYAVLYLTNADNDLEIYHQGQARTDVPNVGTEVKVKNKKVADTYAETVHKENKDLQDGPNYKDQVHYYEDATNYNNGKSIKGMNEK